MNIDFNFDILVDTLNFDKSGDTIDSFVFP
jgi:hypothetical protein